MSLVKVPNSKIYVPTPAVQVTGVSPSGTPCNKFTVPYGIPEAVSNAEFRKYNRNTSGIVNHLGSFLSEICGWLGASL